jgi:hypothetical protein
MIETNTARIELRDKELLIVRIKDGAYQSLADARENLATAMAEGQNRRRPLLVDIRTAQPLEAEVRHFYSGQVLIDGFSALALLVDATPFGRMMGNVYLRIARPGIPTQLFSDEARAIAWLSGYQL